MKTIPLILVALLPAAALAQTATDSSAIRATALDYIEGYYAGDAVRMERALHPDLAKRIVMERPGAAAVVQHMTAEQLVEITRGGGGAETPAEHRRSDVRILDVYGNAAVVRVDAGDWVDFLQLGMVGERWVIINVLWAFRPEALARMRPGGS